MHRDAARLAKKGKPAKQNPWGGLTWEWTVPSPPPMHQFHDEPVLEYGPYDYHLVENIPGLEEDENEVGHE